MFSLKSKLEPNLKSALKNKIYKNYRVIIHCTSLQEKVESKILNSRCTIIRSIPYLGCISASLPLNIIEKLIEYPQVDHICFDNYALLCGSSVLGANGVKLEGKYKLTGKNVCIGVVDSGIYPHTDLKKPNNRIIQFVDLINNLNHPYDDNGHGTFVSGIISSSGFSSNGMYKGVAEKSNIYMIKAFNSLGRGFISDILYGINQLIDESEEYNIKIICLPFEVIDYDEFTLSLFSKLFDKSIENNLVIIVPSGHNTNVEGSMRGIALLNNCITVGGLDITGIKKPYVGSSAGQSGKLEKPDLSAACVDICSLNSDINYISEKEGQKIYPKPIDKLYTSYTGTSCAAAYISGICALLFENNPNLTYKDITSLLKTSCTLLNMSKCVQGSGIINISKLLP